jgi:hypothetical protein
MKLVFNLILMIVLISFKSIGKEKLGIYISNNNVDAYHFSRRYKQIETAPELSGFADRFQQLLKTNHKL